MIEKIKQNQTQSALPIDVTFLDILKTLAVIIMIIDHTGFYFFPGEEWFRAIGRIGMPVWFFLVGYAKGREITNPLFIGAIILIAMDWILFNSILAFNALVTIILIRLSIDLLMCYALYSRYILFLTIIILSLCYFGTSYVFEYGTLAFLFAMAGYITRHQVSLLKETFLSPYDLIGLKVFLFAIFCLTQNAQFGFSDPQFLFLGIGTALIMWTLNYLRPMTFPKLKNPMLIRLLHLGGRKTLEIYVAHLVFFKLILFTSFVLN